MKLQRCLLQNGNTKQAERITKRATNIAKTQHVSQKNAKVGLQQNNPKKENVTMQFYKNATPMGIGNTPLLPYEEDFDADIFFKQESMNVTGSIKDRPALAMILQAEKEGLLTPGCTIVEATSGNMGISLAYIGKQRGYKVLLTMPDNMSIERKQLLQGLGAQLVLTEASLGMQGAVDMANELSQSANHVWLKRSKRHR